MALYRDLPGAQSNLKPAKDGDEYLRTHTKMVVDNGDAPSGKKLVDPRLPKLFKYQFGGQNGYITIPKGRIVSLVPDREFKNFDDNKYYNALTIANGGVDVEERNDDPKLDEPGTEDYTRVANKPVGVAFLNVYQDIDNSFKGNIPSFITRNTINLPYFLERKEAEKLDWGSIYGNDLKPGDRVKPDENGRFVKWNENAVRMDVFDGDGSTDTFQLRTAINPDLDKEEITVVDVDAEQLIDVESVVYSTGEITLASAPTNGDENVEVIYESVLSDSSEQKVGTVININRELIPAGWLQWVSTESPRPNGEEEKLSGYGAQHLDEDQGFPYDPQYREGIGNDNCELNGIEGLTDGSALTKSFEDEKVGEILSTAEVGEKYSVRTLSTPIIRDTVEVKLVQDDSTVVDTSETNDDLIDFMNCDEGLIIVKVTDALAEDVEVLVDYDATGQYPGMPSNINWEGVAGSADILLQL